MSRRTFLRACALSVASLAVSGACGGIPENKRGTAVPATATATGPTSTPPAAATSRVALIRTTDRTVGVRRAIDLASPEGLQGSRVYFKPNFNSANPAPCATHPDTLRTVATALLDRGALQVTVAERSGVGRDTREIAEQVGAMRVAEELGLDFLFLNELDDQGWTKFQPPESHWQDGIPVPRRLLESDAVVQTCNLKTHGFGGHFTLSLKNSVGIVPYELPGGGYNYMNELHGSEYQRSMIAEINTAYSPALVVMDGIEAFIDGGPDQGTKVEAGVILAGSDRVALDAAGVAILRSLGTTPEVSAGPIFEQEQIRRAAELGLGATSPSEIAIVTDDAESEAYAATIRAILAQG